jgi:hypothetical protein
MPDALTLLPFAESRFAGGVHLALVAMAAATGGRRM